MNLRDKLSTNRFVITLEVDPPRGSGMKHSLSEVGPLIPYLDAINVAACPVAKLRMDPVAYAVLLKREYDIETIQHITMRDMTLLGLQSYLLGASALGLDNFLVMTGDAPKHSNIPDTKGVFQGNSMLLMQVMQKMNQGEHTGNGKLNKKNRFYFGATANPTAINQPNEVKKMQKKIDHGASFFQTQPLFMKSTLDDFLMASAEVKTPILISTMLLKNYESSLNLNQTVPGLFVPSETLSRLKQNNNQEEAMRVVIDFLKLCKDRIQGLHLFPMNNYGAMRELLQEISHIRESR